MEPPDNTTETSSDDAVSVARDQSMEQEADTTAFDFDGDINSGTDLANLFKPLASEIRMEILWTLYQSTEPVPFTTLKEEVDIEDSGNFNYHISQLGEQYIHKTKEGYELQYPGRAVIRAIKLGRIASNPELPPRVIDLPCPFCGSDQEFSYSDELVQLRCTNCPGIVGEPYDSGTIMSYEFPASGLQGRTAKAVAAAAHRLYEADITAMIGGACPRCAGTVEGTLDICDDHDTEEGDLCKSCQTRYLAWANYHCRNCGFSRQFPSWFKALHLPEVIAFFEDAAGFTREFPFPKFLTNNGPDLQDISEHIRSIDPIEIVIWLNINSAYCKIVVNGALGVAVEDKCVGMSGESGTPF